MFPPVCCRNAIRSLLSAALGVAKLMSLPGTIASGSANHRSSVSGFQVNPEACKARGVLKSGNAARLASIDRSQLRSLAICIDRVASRAPPLEYHLAASRIAWLLWRRLVPLADSNADIARATGVPTYKITASTDCSFILFPQACGRRPQDDAARASRSHPLRPEHSPTAQQELSSAPDSAPFRARVVETPSTSQYETRHCLPPSALPGEYARSALLRTRMAAAVASACFAVLRSPAPLLVDHP